MSKSKIELLTIISLTLFIGGIALLVMQIPFWSGFLGIPSIQIGIIFIIFTFEKISNQAIEEEIVEKKEELKKTILSNKKYQSKFSP